VESALFLGLCDAITDIIETGWTLRTLSLHEREVLCHYNHSIWLRRYDSQRLISKLEVLMPSVVWGDGAHYSKNFEDTQSTAR
jgi:ATP phosphoribosyltransferase